MRGLNAGLAAVLIAAVLAGCGGGDEAQKGQSAPNETPAEQPPPSTPRKPERKAFDPPKVFEKTEAKFSLSAFNDDERPTVTLHDGNIYGVDDKAIVGIDGLTGENLWMTPATIKASSGAKPTAPVVSGDRLYAAINGNKPAQGTTPSHPQVEVMALDLKSGKADWSTVIDIDLGNKLTTGQGRPAVAGVTDTSVVVSYFDDSASIGRTFVLDKSSHQVRWTKDQFLAAEVDSGVVVGSGGKPLISEKRTTTGLAEADGAQKWSIDTGGYPAKLMPISPKLVASSLKVYSNGDNQFDILDVTTGKPLYSKTTDVPSTSGYDVTCFYDDASLIVCDARGERTFAYDANSVGATPLWEITKSANRVVPTLTAAYHGIVYGFGADDPVAIDGKTGKDAPDAPGVAPALIDKYLAVDVRKQISYKPIK
ncbi:PQQ-binding-like beta-propeller repeat protein [Kibdelosporangium phytohabitans]|uniref:Pyrrolo-quinoline quinone repeat domain-containing protein n=1 Tax=Kibdelosporangium phytohabitans TaxID=860235 RepID=A0A0N9I042_9PSEU|nr:PQQ-binding-like beta-propeller repeat protein [Kibdelosporangium phytohabitans]ALG10947.1 hypothetical protein AOZ06_32300 [Kibdelosporangium phytohabitans]MBE1462147.1 outer membrane protein assembly factor BamB [Kibdelosporangium phytohabitans]